MKIFRYLSIISGLLTAVMLSGVAWADNESAKNVYTLESGIKEAVENNWSVKAREDKITESSYAEKGAKADMLPQVSTSYTFAHLGVVPSIDTEVFGNHVKFEMGDQNTYQWQTTVKQPIFTGYALTSAHELAKLGIDQSKMAVELEKLDLALKVKEAYFNILKADKGVGVVKSAVDSLESHLSVAKNFYDVGMIPVNDVLKAEVELANAKHNLIKAQNEARLARMAFNVLLSKSVDESVEVEDILVFTPETPDYQQSLGKAMKARPEIKSLEISDEQIDRQITIAKSKYYPEVGASASYIKAGDTPNVSGSNFQLDHQWQVGVALTWTFWDWNKTKSSVRQSETMKTELSKTRKAVEDGIKLQVKKAILDLKEAEEKIPSAKKAVEQAEENLRVSEERYKAQVTTSTEVLDAETLLSQARMNYYTALYDHNLARAGLLRAVGEY
jgi:outer membrane protein